VKRAAIAVSLLTALALLGWLLREDAPEAVRPSQASSVGEARRAEIRAPGGDVDSSERLAVAPEESMDAPAQERPAVRGRLVYASTGQGLPWFVLDLHGADGVETLTTDADGRWEASTVREAPLFAYPLDINSPVARRSERVKQSRFEVPAPVDGVTPDVRVEAAPTFVFSIEGECWMWTVSFADPEMSTTRIGRGALSRLGHRRDRLQPPRAARGVRRIARNPSHASVKPTRSDDITPRPRR
jgi:hypothetical protein